MDNDETQSLIRERHTRLPSYGSNIITASSSINVHDNVPGENNTVIKQPRAGEPVTIGSLDYISAEYESLDYDVCENNLLLEEERNKGYVYIVKKNLARWFIFLMIGVLTALVAIFIDISIEQLSDLKFALIKKCILFLSFRNLAIHCLCFILSIKSKFKVNGKCTGNIGVVDNGCIVSNVAQPLSFPLYKITKLM